ncbi:MAG TPA: hypothetical protein VM783_11995, partial [Candidatus Acidoferrum sp.]|nr:hypothetical protein [Candidatus Acidoferrum sp.]
MKRFALRAALFSIAILILAYVSIFFFVRSDGFQQWLKAEAIQRSGYQINLSDLRLMFPFRLAASGLTVSNESETLIQGDRIVVTFSLVDFFSKSIFRIKLEKPILRLDLPKLFDSSAKNSIDIAIRHLNVEDGTVILRTVEGQVENAQCTNRNRCLCPDTAAG